MRTYVKPLLLFGIYGILKVESSSKFSRFEPCVVPTENMEIFGKREKHERAAVVGNFSRIWIRKLSSSMHKLKL